MQLTHTFTAVLAGLACLLGALLLIRPDSVLLRKALSAVCGLLIVTGLTVGL